MRWRWQTTIATALTLLALGAATWLLTAGGKPARDPARARLAAAQGGDPPSPSDPSTVYATVDQGPSGTPLPAGFLGLSLEYTALDAYTGANAASVDPVFVQLLRNLASPAGQPLVLRVGGDSTDATWWPVAGLTPPAGVRYALTPAWLASARALAGAVPAKLILGLNLAANRPRLSAAEASALLSGIGPDDIDAFELGNEPDVYGVFPWYTTSHGAVYARHAGYGLNSYISEVRRWDAGLPDLPLAGPAAAELPWLSGNSRSARRGAPTAHRHRPPLRAPGVLHQPELAFISLGREPAQRPLLGGTRCGARAVRGAGA